MPAPKDLKKRLLWINKLSKAHKGQKPSEETKRKISKAQIGKAGKYIRTEEIINKIKESQKGKHHSSETEFKKGIHYSPETEFKKGEHLGKNNPHWKGGIRKQYGYILIYNPQHPNANKNKYVPEHTLIMSEFLGRPLTKKETIHHKNGIRDDNRIENLELRERANHPNGISIIDRFEYCQDYIKKYRSDYKKLKNVNSNNKLIKQYQTNLKIAI